MVKQFGRGGPNGLDKAVLMLRPLAVGHFASQAAHADLAHQLAMSRRSANRRGGERKLFLSTSLKIFAKKLKARAAWLVETRGNDRVVAVRELKLMARADHEARLVESLERERLALEAKLARQNRWRAHAPL